MYYIDFPLLIVIIKYRGDFMRKTIIILCSVILVFLVAFFSLYFILTTPKNTGDFTVENYIEYIQNENFQTDNNYGKITDCKSAAIVGKKAIADRFENSEGGIFEWMGCSVQYDSENDAYYLRTYHINPNILGGAYDVIIKSDGTVLAIWGEE